MGSLRRAAVRWGRAPGMPAGVEAPQLQSFAAGIRKDYDAVTAGLTLPYSSGKVEGTVNS